MWQKKIGGFSLHDLFWTFVAGCMIGVFVEQVFIYIAVGVMESRVGLVVGPFNPIYGVGAVVMLMCLYRFKRWPALLMLVSALCGSTIEYIFSFCEETFFGTRSWDYSNEPFNLNGRISLKYAFYWAVLGALFIYFIYPALSKLIGLIRGNVGNILSWTMLIFLIVDMIVSAAAVARYKQRYFDPVPHSVVDQILDEAYPDDKIEKIFPSMKKSREQFGLIKSGDSVEEKETSSGESSQAA